MRKQPSGREGAGDKASPSRPSPPTACPPPPGRTATPPAPLPRTAARHRGGAGTGCRQVTPSRLASIFGHPGRRLAGARGATAAQRPTPAHHDTRRRHLYGNPPRPLRRKPHPVASVTGLPPRRAPPRQRPPRGGLFPRQRDGAVPRGDAQLARRGASRGRADVTRRTGEMWRRPRSQRPVSARSGGVGVCVWGG